MQTLAQLLKVAALTAACGFWLPAPASSQVVYENYSFVGFAGVPETGGGSFDGPGSAARFRFPAGATRDAVGNLYFADMDNHTIRKLTAAGVVTTVAGLAETYGSADGAGGAARFTGPGDVVADAVGNLFVADSYNNTIRKIAPGGIVSTLAGSARVSGNADGIGGAARFSYPLGVEVDAAGVLYVADTYNHTIRKITPDGSVTTLCGLAGTSGSADGTGSAARFNYPQDIVVDSSGTLFVSDSVNDTIRKITPAGVVTTLAGAAGVAGAVDGIGPAARFNGPGGLALGAGGKLFVTETGNHTIREITAAGVVTTLAGTAGSAGIDDGTGRAARFSFPFGIVAVGDDLVVADAFNHTVRRITSSAAVTTIAGSPVFGGSSDGPSRDARFNVPQDVAIDLDGAVYVVDGLNDIIRKIVNGVVTTFAGSAGAAGSTDGTGGAARFNHPVGLAAANGLIYVADTDNHTIRKITPDGKVTTLAGLAGVPGSVDGTGTTARFNGPFRLAVDGAGVLYVGDTGNNLIRKVTPGGLVTTLAGKAGVAGSADGTGSGASFYAPEGIAVDGNGNVFVADDGNQTIRKITPDGVVTVFAGTTGETGSADGVGGAALFNYPFGLAADRNNNLYVTDSGNHTIRKITPEGKVTTVAGAPGLAGNVDGVASAVRFDLVAGVALDNDGNLYVADAGNQTIRKGFVPPPDLPVVDPVSARAGTTRHFDVANATTTSWSWSLIRCPASASTQLWSATTRNPVLTPDVDDLYVVRFQGWDNAGRTAIRTLTISGVNASVLRLIVSRSAALGAIDLDLDGPAETSGRIELSSDFASWAPLAEFAITNSPVRFHDSPAGPGYRFYRAVSP
jgi:sugar lactone lactonase YvrE